MSEPNSIEVLRFMFAPYLRGLFLSKSYVRVETHPYGPEVDVIAHGIKFTLKPWWFMGNLVYGDIEVYGHVINNIPIMSFHPNSVATDNFISSICAVPNRDGALWGLQLMHSMLSAGGFLYCHPSNVCTYSSSYLRYSVFLFYLMEIGGMAQVLNNIMYLAPGLSAQEWDKLQMVVDSFCLYHGGGYI